MANSKIGGAAASGTVSTALPNQKQASFTGSRMLEASEIDFLRKTQKARYAKRKAKRQAAE